MNSMPENANEDTEPVVLLSYGDERYSYILEELQDYYDADLAEIQKAKDTLEDLREARRHCSTYEEFANFSEAMDDAQDWLKNNNWSRAGAMIDYLRQCYEKMLDYINADDNLNREGVFDRFKVAIIWSE